MFVLSQNITLSFMCTCFVQVNKILRAAEHRPFNAKSEGHQRFLRGRLQKINELERLCPNLDLDKERALFESQLLEAPVLSGH